MLARPFRRFLTLLIVVPVAVVAAAFGVALFEAPSVADLAIRVATLERVNDVKPVRLSRLPATLGEAVVATEDERFYRQSGVDVLALGRAVPFDITHLSLAQGASTITEQLAKIVYLAGNDHSPWRKLTDIALGFRIGHRYDHEQVLSDYLNVAYFGAGAYGVENAAQRYFGRHATGLDLAQASLLGGLIQAPSHYDPILHPLRARDRQIAVLRSMVRNGYVTEARATAVIEHAAPAHRRPFPAARSGGELRPSAAVRLG